MTATRSDIALPWTGRVLILTATYPPTRCGVGEYVKRLGAELAREGAQIDVLTGVGEDPAHRHDAEAGEEQLAIEPPPVVWAAAPPPRFEPGERGVRVARAVPHWNWGVLPVVQAAIAQERTALVNLQYHGEDYLLHPAVCSVPWLCARHGVPTVTTLHNLQTPRRWPGAADQLQTLMRASAGLIVTNRLDHSALELLLPSRADDRRAACPAAHLIPAGPCITAPAAGLRRAGTGPLRLFYFGFLNPFKGIEYLLRAVALLRDEGTAVALTLAAGIHTDAPGRLRAYARTIDRQIETLKLGPELTRLDYVPDGEISRLLQECELAVFPFRDGVSGKNSSFWGALHHGAPALTTRGPGLPEGLADQDNVLLAAVDDAAALAERIRWAVEHRALLPQIGERGRHYVAERHGWQGLARQTLGVFAAARASGRQGAWA